MRNLGTAIILVLTYFTASTQGLANFEHFSTDEGLPHVRINAITQDSLGFLWIGTQAGICRYDGINFQTYPYNSHGSGAQSPKYCGHVIHDIQGNIWVDDAFQLYSYDGPRDQFMAYGLESMAPNTRIAELYADRRNNIWIGTEAHGLFRVDVINKQFSSFNEEFDRDLPLGAVTHIIEDRFGKLWFSYPNGLYRFDWRDSTLVYFPLRSNLEVGYFDGVVQRMFADSNGFLWIVTASGFFLVKEDLDSPEKITGSDSLKMFVPSELTDGQITARNSDGIMYHFDPATPDSGLVKEMISENSPELINQFFRTVYRASNGDLWAGTLRHGLYHWSSQQKAFKTYQTILDQQAYDVCFLEEENGQIFTTSNTLVSFNPKEDKFYAEPEFRRIQAGYMTKDQNSWIWVGSWNGLKKFNYETKEVVEYRPESGNPHSVPGTAVPLIWIDHKGIVWINVRGKGIYQYRPATDDFEPFRLADSVQNKYLSNRIHAVTEDHDGNLWMSTTNHLIKLNTDRKFVAAIPFPRINWLYEDDDHLLWLASEEGLYRFDPISGKSKLWTQKHGLSHNQVKCILKDDSGNLWLGTQHGLSKFNLKTEVFQNYTKADGLPGNIFVPGRCMKTSTGEFYFSFLDGCILRFHPDSIKDNPHVPNIVITDFRIRTQPVPIEGQQDSTWRGKSPLMCNISYATEIKLNWQQNDFSFEFASLNYLSSEKNKYRYRLSNYDKDWILTDQKQPFATYTNLDPGKYIFQVKGSNNDGIWNEEGVSLSIIIIPPWWWSFWSKTFYLLAILLSLLWIRNYERKREQLRYALEVEKVKGEKLEEVSELKARFFTNISHELRTPLTLILGPLKELIGRNKSRDLGSLKLIERNAERLLDLVNQLLDLARIDTNHLPLQASENDLVAFVRQIFHIYITTATSRNIQYTFSCDKTFLTAYFDRDKLEKILVNLISNAFKFTPDGEEIEVVLKEVEEYAQISIIDSGIGIPEDQLLKIYDRFYQVDSSATRTFEGSGIGLALAKELVELHHGSITVSNDPTGGACFVVRLPLGTQHLREGEIIELHKSENGLVTMIGNMGLSSAAQEPPVYVLDDLPLVLIVEDNSDMRLYLQQVLSSHYRITEASDGIQGLRYAKEQIPDLVISDIMMPGMTGLEFCIHLKSDMLTCHIPIILLTAKANMDSRIEGLQQGADAYLTKPFDHQELLVRTRALIELRKKLRERYQSEAFSGGDDTDEKEDLFLLNLKQLIFENLSDPDFSIPQICRKMGISRAQLYRKMKVVTNDSVGNYLLKIRLYKAKELLRTSDLNVSEVAYDVGFKDPAYFSRVFKKMFDQNPSEIK